MENAPLFDDVPPRGRVVREISEVVVGHNHPVCLLCVLQHESEGKGQKEAERLGITAGKGFFA